MDYGLDTHKMAYLAGFFEGEGCVLIVYKKSPKLRYPTYQLGVAIANVDKTPLQIIKDTWGGSIYRRTPKSDSHQPCYRLMLAGESSEDFLRSITPYLLFKNREVELGLEFRRFKKNEPHYGSGYPKSKASNDYQEYIYKTLQKLKLQRGKEVEAKLL